MLYCSAASKFLFETWFHNFSDARVPRVSKIYEIMHFIYDEVRKKAYDAIFIGNVVEQNKSIYMDDAEMASSGMASIGLYELEDRKDLDDVFLKFTRVFVKKDANLANCEKIFSQLLDEAYENSRKNYLPVKCWREKFPEIKIPHYSEFRNKLGILGNFSYKGHKYLICAEDLVDGGEDSHLHNISIKYPCSLSDDPEPIRLKRAAFEQRYICLGKNKKKIIEMICSMKIRDLLTFLNIFMLQDAHALDCACPICLHEEEEEY